MENRVVATLLTVMGGMEANDRVVVIGATNRLAPLSLFVHL
jgi:SpoVK/Ycf46/Vps4 family AAA+-type ATPase